MQTIAGMQSPSWHQPSGTGRVCGVSARQECERAKRGQLGSGASRPPLTALGATLNAGAPRMSGSYQECRSDWRFKRRTNCDISALAYATGRDVAFVF